MAINSQLNQGYAGFFNSEGLTASIANGQTISSTIATGGYTLCGLYMPTAFTGATVSFMVAPSASPGVPGTFSALYNGSTLYSLTATASAYIAVDQDLFQGVAYFQVKSASSEGAARTLICSLKGLS